MTIGIWSINGELVAAAKRMPGHVVGDGSRTDADLIEIVNGDPRRGMATKRC